jgi:uncharacterized protein (DUF849 family)
MKALTPAVGSTVRPGDADQGKLLRERFAARKIIKRRYHQTLRQIAGGAPKMTSAQGSAGLATPTMSPYLPITPDQIAAEAIAAAEAGAAILHLHARDPETGKPDQSPETFARFLPRIKQGTTAAINITTGGSPYMRVEERVLPAATFKPEVASLNMGSMNFGLYHLLPKYKEFKFDWEKAHLEATRDLVFRNSYKDIEFILATCYGNGTRFEFECYDIAVALATDAGRINGS